MLVTVHYLILAYSAPSAPYDMLSASELPGWIAQFSSAILHYDDVIMTSMAPQITRLTIVYSTVYSGAYKRKHQSSASLAFVRGIHRGPVICPHIWPVTRKRFPFDDVIMYKNVIRSAEMTASPLIATQSWQYYVYIGNHLCSHW